jgi:pimeloyl-ACP methyl ester carboxylesterase
MKSRVLLHDDKGRGEPIMLVPGGLTGWLSWIPHQERLASQYRVVRIQPIHNELGSAGRIPEAGYDHDVERDSVAKTLDELGIEAPHLAGWSGGARSLINFAVAYPDRIRTLTLIEPPAYWAGEEAGLDDEQLRRIRAFSARVAGRSVSEDDLAEFLTLAGFASSPEEAKAGPNWERWLPHRQTLAADHMVGNPPLHLSDLERVDRPVLLVKGTVSTEWLRRIVDVLGQRFPQATVLELPGTHACHIESMDAFLEALRKHVTSG